jgi:hypothetical protein
LGWWGHGPAPSALPRLTEMFSKKNAVDEAATQKVEKK